MPDWNSQSGIFIFNRAGGYAGAARQILIIS